MEDGQAVGTTPSPDYLSIQCSFILYGQKQKAQKSEIPLSQLGTVKMSSLSVYHEATTTNSGRQRFFFSQKVKVLILLLTFSEEHWRKLPVCCAPWFVGIQ